MFKVIEHKHVFLVSTMIVSYDQYFFYVCVGFDIDLWNLSVISLLDYVEYIELLGYNIVLCCVTSSTFRNFIAMIWQDKTNLFHKQ
jgi:hypothetical protein